MGMIKRFPVHAVWALAVQFLLGMYVTMYVSFPADASTQAAWESASGNVWVLLHIVVGLFILLGSVSYLVAVIRQKQKQLLGYAVVGLAAILAAVTGGERFISLQDDGYSMLMAIGFIGAVVTYALAARVPVTIKK